MTRLFSNENFSHPVVRELRRLGNDVLTSRDAGRADQGIPDDEVLAFAIDQRRAVLTFNRRHFIRLHLRRPEHAGIIVCTQDPDAAALAARIHDAIGSLPGLHGRLVRIRRPNLADQQRKPNP